MRKTLKYLLLVFIILNLLVVLSGRLWMYKAIGITYLKGYNSSYIDDFVHFPPNSQNQNTAAPQPYSYTVKLASENEHIYDETNLNQDYEPVTFGRWLG